MAYGTRRFNAAHAGLSNNPYPEPNQPNSCIDTYFLLVHSNIVLPLRLGLPKCHFPAGLPIKFWKYSCLPPFWLHDLPISIFLI